VLAFDGVIGSSCWCVQSLAKQVMGLSKFRKFDTAPAGRFSLADDAFERLLPAISLYCRFWPNSVFAALPDS
jgi:hypothetical protein